MGSLGNLNNPVKYAFQAYEIDYRKNSGWVIATWYEVLNVTGGFELLNLEGHQTNTPTNAEELDIRITVDGRVYTYDSSAIATWNNSDDECFSLRYFTPFSADPILYMHNLNEYQMVTMLSSGAGPEINLGSLKGHDLLIEIQDTAGPSAGLDVYMHGEYRLMEAT